MPANMLMNRFSLSGVVMFGALVSSHLANLSKVARIEATSVFVILKFLPPPTLRLTRSPCACPNSV